MRAAPTYRLVFLVLAAGAPALLSGWAWLSGVLNICLLVTVVVDLALSQRRIEMMRQPGPVQSIGAECPIRFELRSPGPPLELELKDDLPLTFEQVGDWPRIRVGSPEWQTAQYHVRPKRRGQFTLGPVHGRYTSRLGLWRRHVTWKLTEPVRVYPDLRAARQWEIAIRRGHELEGQKRAHRRGGGTDFESLREYQPGDQYRAINWPASARQGKLISTLYQVDRSQPILLLLDAGRLMIPQMKGLSKLDHSLSAALLLATVAAERGDQTGLMLFGGEVHAFMPPRKGRGQVLAMAETLYDVEPEQVEPDYGRLLGWLRAKHKRRSLVVLFTDLVDPEISRRLVQHLVALAAHHLVMLVCLTDPELLRLSEAIPANATDLYRKTTAMAVLSLRAETKARLQSAGVIVVDVPPERFSTAVVNQYLLIKEQGRL